MKTLFVTLMFSFFSLSYTSRIEMKYDEDKKELLIIQEGKEYIEEISIYSNKELLMSFVPSIDTIRIERECPLAGRISYVIKLRSGVIIRDSRNSKTDLRYTSSFIEITEPKD